MLFWLAETLAGGTLDLQAADGGRTTATITGARTTEELIVVPNGVQVRNTPASVAGYSLTVGPGMRVHLRVGANGVTRDTVLVATSQLTRIELGPIRSR